MGGGHGFASSRTYRPVVDQCHLHHRLELAILDPVGRVALLDSLHKVVIEPAGFFRVGGAVKVGLGALLRLGEERELRY